MASGRMLKTRLKYSKKFAALKTDTARMLYTTLYPHLDVEGRLEADPEIFKATVCPLLKITHKTISACLQDMHSVGLIVLYTVNNSLYLSVTRFQDFQNINKDREAESEIPAPPETPKRIAFTKEQHINTWHKWEESGRVCPLCNKQAQFIVGKGWVIDSHIKSQIDHIIPVSQGGTNEESNLRVVCQKCNASKGNIMETSVSGEIMDYSGELQSNDGVLPLKIREDKIREDKYKVSFEIARKLYPDRKRGLETEFKNFSHKHKDWVEVLPLLMPAIQKQMAWRAGLKLQQATNPKVFIPNWKNFQTWINQRCWEEEPPTMPAKTNQPKKCFCCKKPTTIEIQTGRGRQQICLACLDLFKAAPNLKYHNSNKAIPKDRLEPCQIEDLILKQKAKSQMADIA